MNFEKRSRSLGSSRMASQRRRWLARPLVSCSLHTKLCVRTCVCVCMRDTLRDHGIPLRFVSTGLHPFEGQRRGRWPVTMHIRCYEMWQICSGAYLSSSTPADSGGRESPPPHTPCIENGRVTVPVWSTGTLYNRVVHIPGRKYHSSVR